MPVYKVVSDTEFLPLWALTKTHYGWLFYLGTLLYSQHAQTRLYRTMWVNYPMTSNFSPWCVTIKHTIPCYNKTHNLYNQQKQTNSNTSTRWIGLTPVTDSWASNYLKQTVKAICLIPTISTLITPNLVTTRISHCLLHLQIFNILYDFIFPCWSASSYDFHVITVLQNTLQSTPWNSCHTMIIYCWWWSWEKIFQPLRLIKNILYSLYFFIPFINTRNKNKISWSHPTTLFLWGNQEQSNATPADPGVITRYHSQTTKYPSKQSKTLYLHLFWTQMI